MIKFEKTLQEYVTKKLYFIVIFASLLCRKRPLTFILLRDESRALSLEVSAQLTRDKWKDFDSATPTNTFHFRYYCSKDNHIYPLSTYCRHENKYSCHCYTYNIVYIMSALSSLRDIATYNYYNYSPCTWCKAVAGGRVSAHRADCRARPSPSHPLHPPIKRASGRAQQTGESLSWKGSERTTSPDTSEIHFENKMAIVFFKWVNRMVYGWYSNNLVFKTSLHDHMCLYMVCINVCFFGHSPNWMANLLTNPVLIPFVVFDGLWMQWGWSGPQMIFLKS